MSVAKPSRFFVEKSGVQRGETLPAHERRQAVRYRAAGSVTLRQPEEAPQSFEGRLLDISASGFRVVHDNNQLRSGQECEFALPGSSGRARVVWNRITPTHVESGFLILSCDAA
ncbi:MAG: PilZ domain-containing protein [Bryobacter sp.]|nr:PilZ domain-containing protein [Bryobacter sp.]